MVAFWDTSAIVPLLITEPATQRIAAVFAEDPDQVVWWGTRVECVSALERRRRLEPGKMPVEVAGQARLKELESAWEEVQPSNSVRETAIRLLQTHELRAADALQLAAAFAASEGRPSTLGFVSLDAHLNEAASREGFRLVDI